MKDNADMIHKGPLRLFAFWILFAGLSSIPAQAQTNPATQPSEAFLRFVHNVDADTGHLDSAIVSYVNSAGVTVNLVAAVHVGDKAYYDRLNTLFKTYDSLLYEMVKPKDADVPQPGQAGGAISFLQRALKNVLALQFQLDAIDYSAANFVHADLDADTFHRMQAQRGESMIGLMLQQILRDMASNDADAKDPDLQTAEFLAALTSPDRPRQLKLLLAEQFQDLDSKLAGLDGPDGSVLLTERNKAAIRTLKKQLDKGDKSIGIFYGAAHMGDLSRRLEEMGFHATKRQWLTAWDMNTPAATRPAGEAAEKPQ